MKRLSISGVLIFLPVFLIGILTLGIEMAAGRLITPLLGSTLVQWSALIGTALISYSLGYFFHNAIFKTGEMVALFVAASYTALIPLIIKQTSKTLLTLDYQIAAILISFICIGLPSIIWAAYLPQLIEKYRSPRRVLILSTIGNLCGVWGVSFYLIPKFGVRSTFAVLSLTGVIVSLVHIRKKVKFIPALIVYTLVIIFFRSEIVVNESVVKESAYQRLEVRQDNTGGVRTVYFLMDGILQFIWNPSEAMHDGGSLNYFNFATVASTWTKALDKPKVLIIGAGGGIVPYQIEKLYPMSDVTVHEIDAEVVKIAKNILPLGMLKNSQVIVGDSRSILSRSAEMYDYIFLDAFVGSHLPLHLTSVENFQILFDHLNPGGLIVANFIEFYRETGLLSNLGTTIRNVFHNIHSARLEPNINTMLLAWKGEKTFDTPQTDYEKLVKPATFEFSSGTVLTDDLNDSELRLHNTQQKISAFIE